MRSEIQSAFDSSLFRFVPVACHGLKCSNPDLTKGMQMLQERSRQFSDAENRETCSSYRETSKAIEKEFSRETWSRYTRPAGRKMKSPKYALGALHGMA
jgi:hypothetical protein